MDKQEIRTIRQVEGKSIEIGFEDIKECYCKATGEFKKRHYFRTVIIPFERITELQKVISGVLE